MNWKRIPKENSEIPQRGKYSDWKDILADEGFNQCVYCTIHEGSFGRRNYHVEHYKPKGLTQFKQLENDFLNLFFACCICNCFKGEFWAEPIDDHSVSAFPDPSKVNYSELVEIQNDAYLIGKNIAGKFVVEKLFLNRPQLLLERRLMLQISRLKSAVRSVAYLKDNLQKTALEGNPQAIKYLGEIVTLSIQMNYIQAIIRELVPFVSGDVQR